MSVLFPQGSRPFRHIVYNVSYIYIMCYSKTPSTPPPTIFTSPELPPAFTMNRISLIDGAITLTSRSPHECSRHKQVQPSTCISSLTLHPFYRTGNWGWPRSEDTKLISLTKHSEDGCTRGTIFTGCQLGTGRGRWTRFLPHLVDVWLRRCHTALLLSSGTLHRPLLYVLEYEVSSLIHHPSSQPCAKSFSHCSRDYVLFNHLTLLHPVRWYHDYHFTHRGKSLNKLEVSNTYIKRLDINKYTKGRTVAAFDVGLS